MDSDDEIFSTPKGHVRSLSQLSATSEHWRNNPFLGNSFDFSLSTSEKKVIEEEEEEYRIPETPRFIIEDQSHPQNPKHTLDLCILSFLVLIGGSAGGIWAYITS